MGRRVGDRYMSKIREYFREEKKGLLLVERIRGFCVVIRELCLWGGGKLYKRRGKEYFALAGNGFSTFNT